MDAFWPIQLHHGYLVPVYTNRRQVVDTRREMTQKLRCFCWGVVWQGFRRGLLFLILGRGVVGPFVALNSRMWSAFRNRCMAGVRIPDTNNWCYPPAPKPGPKHTARAARGRLARCTRRYAASDSVHASDSNSHVLSLIRPRALGTEVPSPENAPFNFLCSLSFVGCFCPECFHFYIEVWNFPFWWRLVEILHFHKRFEISPFHLSDRVCSVRGKGQ